MLHDPWKRRLLRFAHTGREQKFPLRTRLELPKTILGRKIVQSKIMTPSFSWLQKIKGEVRRDELMLNHTSLRIGGPADFFIVPQSLRDLRIIFKSKGDTPVFVLGEGTNLLVRDKGIRGIVVSLRECFRSIQTPRFRKTRDGRETAVIKAGASVKLSYLAKHAAKHSLTGIERLVGIPGSLGGALIMNAGAEGDEVGQVVRSVTRLTPDGNLQTLWREDLDFQYRKTHFPSEEGIIVEAELELETGDSLEIHQRMDAHLSGRNIKQPLTIPNAGSIFKNPPGAAAGRLIEQAGLKGLRIEDASVSIKHANFIVNQGNAQARDVLGLIQHIQKVVKEKTGKDLETEIVIVGEED